MEYKLSDFMELKKKKQQQYINIKVDKNKYSEIVSLLQNHGLLEDCIV